MFERPRFSILPLLIFFFAIGGVIDAQASRETLLDKENLLLKAERLFFEQSYDDALAYYADLAFRQPEEQSKLREALLSRITACHLEMNRPLDALNILFKKDSLLSSDLLQSSFLDRVKASGLSDRKLPHISNIGLFTIAQPRELSPNLEMNSEAGQRINRPIELYLLGRSYGKLGKFAEGVDVLSRIPRELEDSATFTISSKKSNSLLALEKGVLLSQLGDLSSAKTILQTIPLVEAAPLPFLLAQLQLAKNCLSAQDWEKAKNILSSLSEFTSDYHLLEKERIYLEGVLFTETDAPEEVIRCFGQLSEKERFSEPFIGMLSRCFLKQAIRRKLPQEELTSLLNQTEQLLQHLMQSSANDQNLELISTFYLIKSRTLSDEQAYVQAQEYLARLGSRQSDEGLQMILLKEAEGAPTYQERNRLYTALTEQANTSPLFLARGFTLKGLNHFFEGMKWQDAYQKEAMAFQFDEAIRAFTFAIDLFPSGDAQEIALALKYKILAHAMQHTANNVEEGWKTIRILLETPSFIRTFHSPEELYSLAAWLALQTSEEKNWSLAKETLSQLFNVPSACSSSTIISQQLYVHLCLKLNQTAEADKILHWLLENHAAAAKHRGQLLLLLAYSADLQHNKTLKQHYLRRTFTEDPGSPAAPIAYFHLYSYADYVKGNRHVLKHLQAMPSLFPSHPLLINAYYLIGLCQKKEQLSEEGQVLRRKNTIAAIDAFHHAEITFDSLVEKKLIPEKDLDYYRQMRERAQLERAQANFAIAQQSTGGKKEIYLAYAEEVYQELISKISSDLLQSSFLDRVKAPGLSDLEMNFEAGQRITSQTQIEAQFLLAQTLNEMGKTPEAERWLELSIKKGPAQGYWLMKTWVEKGKLLQKRGELSSALQAFVMAEEAIPDGKGMSPDEKLDIWIEQSLCYREMQQYDEAMRLLSRVINDDVISSRRIKAMYLRAETYELQNRPELALKQLESTARKGGEWALKAQKKLEENYGY
jgi:hypothetical protein